MIFRTSDDGLVMNSDSEIELVRCKDCKYYSGFTCENMKNERMIGMIVADDWFCADGRKKDDKG